MLRKSWVDGGERGECRGWLRGGREGEVGWVGYGVYVAGVAGDALGGWAAMVDDEGIVKARGRVGCAPETQRAL